MKKSVHILILALCSWSLTLSAQSPDPIRFSSLNPLVSQYNPSHYTPYGGYVSFPLLSNLGLSFYNPSFRYKKLFDKDDSEKITTRAANRFLSFMSNTNNLLTLNFNEELIGFGFRVNKWFFSFSHQFKFEEQFYYSRDLWGLIIKGNKGYMGSDNPAYIDLKLNITSYRETAIGIHYKINDHFSVGMRPKLIRGVYNVNVPDFIFQLYTNPDDNSLLLRYRSMMNISTPISLVEEDSEGNLVFRKFDISEFFTQLLKKGKTNFGFGIDLGGSYQINDHFKVSVYANDIGFIKWRSETIRIKTRPFAEDDYAAVEGEYEFSELNQDMISEFLAGDSLRKIFDFTFVDSCMKNLITIERVPYYYTTLTSQIGIEGVYRLNPSNRFIALFKGYIINKRLFPIFTVAYNGTYWNIIDVIVSYSMMQKSFTNLGIGIGFKFGPFHIYGGTNNIFSIFRPLNSSLVNYQLGISFAWSHKKYKETNIKY